MDRETFWDIVERARRAAGRETVTAEGADVVARHLVAELSALSPAAIVGFEQAYDDVTSEGWRWDLWAAAYLMRGGCSDDGFDYFRGWLVAQGRTVWERAVADPDSLAGAGVDPDDDAVECEAVLSAAGDAYAEATGAGTDAFWEALDAADRAAPPGPAPADPAGEDFDFDDDEQMRARLPRLTAIYRPVE
ncbi:MULTISPECIES: DUF4240 domain-containing protein [unclassified Micromonospora]|uniref:DUF4240 domain-containing protein n=1 Tax=unclassified Micromonospora TaxID=2617518 RepID=UPI0022B66F72|nr:MULTISPECIES: DUF4240 domain-containing protein [unclassified Micromonospora]MCZ7474192.1 DUF4240 domain-containing protein [Micromonospora sp. WMMC273]WBC04846.1 DUF4240 domain-containing protein [Micromonospora sp. WMMA1976]